MKSLFVAVLLFIIVANGNSQTFNSRTFIYSYLDVHANNYIESGILATEGYSNKANMYFQGNYKIFSKFAIAAYLNFRGDILNFDESNTILIAKYNLVDDEIKLSIGPYYEIAEGSWGIWGSYSQKVLNNFGLTAKAALIYQSEIFGEYYYILGSGFSFPILKSLDMITEAVYTSGFNVAGWQNRYYHHSEIIFMSSGLSYNLYNEINIRGAFGYNILDTNPDIMMNINLSYSF